MENCSAVLSFEPTSAKALFRRAQAHERLGNKALAEADLVEGMRLKPSDTAFSAALAALRGQAVVTEAASAKEERRRKAGGDTADSGELPSSSTLLVKAKQAIAAGNGSAEQSKAKKLPAKKVGAPKGFHGGSFITAEGLAKAGIANIPQAKQVPPPKQHQQSQSGVELSPATSVTEASVKAPTPPTHRRRSSSGSTGSVSPPTDRMAASTTALPPAVPKAKPKPRVPSPTPEPLAVAPVSASTTQDTAAVSSTVAIGRHTASATPLQIATELLAAFDGDFSKAVECLLTAHKFA